MDYLTAAEIADKWKVSSRMVAYYCESGRIEGAVKKGKTMVLEGGHYIHYQNEEQIAEIVKQFFGETNETGK